MWYISIGHIPYHQYITDSKVEICRGGQSTIAVEAIAVEMIAVEVITVEAIAVEAITVDMIAVEMIALEVITVNLGGSINDCC